MSELIWYSIPGTIFMVFLAFVGLLSDLDIRIILGLTVPVGFALHQLFRTLFERFYGWHLPSRRVIAQLQQRYEIETRPKAFLVWEMTLYSNKIDKDAAEIPESFRKHNRDSWHYVLSFWSCTFVSFLCSLGVLASGLFGRNLGWSSFLFFFCMICLGCFFWIKGNLTYDAINQQEIAAATLYKSAFDKTAESLGYKTPALPEKSVNHRSTFWCFLIGLLRN